MSRRRLPLLAAVVAFVLTIVALAPFSLTFLADDWVRFAEVAEGQNLWTESLRTSWARVPVWTLLSPITYEVRLYERGFVLFYFYLAIHLASLVLIARWLILRVARNSAGSRRTMVIILTAIALYPACYEVLLWPTCMPYALGAGFVAAALYSEKRDALRILFLLLAFLTYETFLLPALAWLVLPSVVSWVETRQRPKEITSLLLAWLAAIAAWLAVRTIIGAATGAYPHALSFDWAHILTQANHAGFQLAKIHFYATNNIATGLQFAVVLTFASFAIVRDANWRRRLLAVITSVLLVCFSAAHYLFLPYAAGRALYGSKLLLTSILAVLFWWGSQKLRPIVTYALLAILIVTYLGHTIYIGTFKDANATILAERRAELTEQIRLCPDPCTIRIAHLDRGLRRDWVLHRDYWLGFARLVRASEAAHKEVHFVLDDE